MASTTSGGMRAATYRPGSPTAWVAIDLPGVSGDPGSALASAAPAQGLSRFFAIGQDHKVYSIDCDPSAGFQAGAPWSEVAPDGDGVVTRAGSGLAALSRVSGQVEVYAQLDDGSLSKAWWS